MNLSSRDDAVIWHPYTQHKNMHSPLPIKAGKGAYLIDENNQCYLDLTSSWWVNLHGHAQPDIAKAIYEQALQIEHVLFSGYTHEPAVAYAEQLLQLLPCGFAKIFYSDNGSTAVEVALKMAYQYWRNKGESNRSRFMSFHHSYHGDTFGAMAVGKNSHFFSEFHDLLFHVDMFDYPATWLHDTDVQKKEQQTLQAIDQHLARYASKTVALIIEPLVQGSCGMRMCTPRFLQKLEHLLQAYNILIIYDEVMTGFGRTSKHFACTHAGTTPDFICLAKGITGGFLPLAATACHQRIYETFLGDTFKQALAHGHSYAGNPLGCAAALASLALLLDTKTQKQIQTIVNLHSERLPELADLPNVAQVRQCGTIAAFNLKQDIRYGSEQSWSLIKFFMAKGLMIRPLGHVIYLLAPYCITTKELHYVYDTVLEYIQECVT